MAQIDGFINERVVSNGVTLNAWRGGSGPVVVLMHGWCGSSYTWRSLAPLLARDHDVIVPDMRGYGDSDKPDAGYDAASAASDMAGLLDHYKVERAHMVGHDMGAPVALVFAGRHPERTASFAWLDEPLLGYDTERYTAYTDWNHGGYWQFGFNSTPGLAELMYAGREEAFLSLIYGLMTVQKSAITPEVVREQARGMKGENGIRGWVGWYRAALETGAQVRALGEAGGVRAPCLAVRGDVGVAGILDEIRQAVPHATTATIAQCGHLIAEEQPHKLARLLRAHFGDGEEA